MTARNPHSGALLVALPCIVWIALAPVIPQVLQAFASHRHVFCPEHDRIEDDGIGQDRDRASGALPATETQVASASVVSDGFGSRPACLFSNVVVQFSSAVGPSCSAPIALEEREINVTWTVAVRVAKIIRFAPKHSPPEQRA